MKNVLRKIVPVLLLLAAFSAQAQDEGGAEWSNSEKFRNRTAYNKILGQNETGIYVLRSKSRFFSRRVYVQLYKANMGLVFNKLLPGIKKYTFENAFVTPEGLTVFKSRYTRKTATIDLYYQTYTTEAEPVGQEQYITASPQRDFSDIGDYVIKQSLDRSKFMCFHTEITSTKTTIVELVVFDAKTMQELSRKKTELPYRYGAFYPLDMEVSNNGDAYFIFRVDDDERKKNEPERIGYYLFAYKAATGDFTPFYLNNKDTYLSRMTLTLDYLNNKAITCGFYSLEESGKSKGIIDFAVNLSSQAVMYHTFIPYTEDFVGSIIGRTNAAKGEELQDFYIKKIIPHSNGGYILVAEEYYTSTQTYTFSINGMMQVGNREIYNYGKVVLLGVNNTTSSFDWGKVINKLQTSSLDLGYYSSVYIVPLKNHVNIFYNDNERGSSEITMYTLNNKGELGSRLLFKNQSSNISFVPREAVQLDAITVLFPAAKDRKFAFLKLPVN